MGCCLEPVVMGSAFAGAAYGQQSVSLEFLCKRGLAFVFVFSALTAWLC